jgi:putative spermidine/putrescine transport system ATP-binding protein
MNHTSTGSSIQLIDVGKTYGEVIALDSVSMTAQPGEFVTFLGPSGSGKTTTLNIIAGFTTATSGQVLLDGVDMADRAPHKRNLGVVFQNYALFPHMTVRDNIAFGLRRRRVPADEQKRRVDEALDMVRLIGYGERRPAELSGGQQQRVALARALVYRPSVLLLDEPLGALDKRLREQMQVEISRLHRELGMTFLFVTHDQEEALALSDRIALFEAGRLVQVGTPEELYEGPRSLFAAEFLGESNIFRGTIDDQGRIRQGDRALRIPAHAAIHAKECAVVVRPERLQLSDASSERAQEGAQLNSVAALVTDVTYLGAHRRIGLRFADGSTGAAREPAGHQSTVGAGDAVTAVWDPSHSMVVPVEGRAS